MATYCDGVDCDCDCDCYDSGTIGRVLRVTLSITFFSFSFVLFLFYLSSVVDVTLFNS